MGSNPFQNMAGLGNMLGQTSTVGSYMGMGMAGHQQSLQDIFQGRPQGFIQSGTATPPTMRSVLQPKVKEQSMFTEIATDVKRFVIEHRSVIYFLAFALIVDHLFFKDAFRHRLQAMADKIVSKVEAKI